MVCFIVGFIRLSKTREGIHNERVFYNIKCVFYSFPISCNYTQILTNSLELAFYNEENVKCFSLIYQLNSNILMHSFLKLNFNVGNKITDFKNHQF